ELPDRTSDLPELPHEPPPAGPWEAGAWPDRPAKARPATASWRRPMWGFGAVLAKEFFHIRRQATTIFFMLVIPTLQTLIFGYAIDVKIEHIPLVVHDLDGRRDAQE